MSLFSFSMTLAIIGLILLIISNVMYFQRTKDKEELKKFWLAKDVLTRNEYLANRIGFGLTVIGIVLMYTEPLVWSSLWESGVKVKCQVENAVMRSDLIPPSLDNDLVENLINLADEIVTPFDTGLNSIAFQSVSIFIKSLIPFLEPSPHVVL